MSKKCFHFPSWKEKKDVMVSLDNEKLIMLNDLQYETPRDIGIDDCIRDNYTNKSTPSDPIFQKYPLLLELQKKLGFDVYGEYVVLIKEDKYLEGDFYTQKNKGHYAFLTNRTNPDHNNIFFSGFQETLKRERNNILISTRIVNGFILLNTQGLRDLDLYQGNIIKELSKYYRGEENKFEEVVRKVLGV